LFSPSTPLHDLPPSSHSPACPYRQTNRRGLVVPPQIHRMCRRSAPALMLVLVRRLVRLYGSASTIGSGWLSTRQRKPTSSLTSLGEVGRTSRANTIIPQAVIQQTWDRQHHGQPCDNCALRRGRAARSVVGPRPTAHRLLTPNESANAPSTASFVDPSGRSCSALYPCVLCGTVNSVP
jgi:hypothetical protein